MVAVPRSVPTFGAVVAVALSVATGIPAPTSFAATPVPHPSPSISGAAQGSTLFLDAERTISIGKESATTERDSAVASRPDYARLFVCWVLDATIYQIDPLEGMEACPPGTVPVAADGTPVVVSARDLQELPIDPGVLVMQPDRGNVLVNIETVAYTGAVAQRFDTALLGVPVAVWVTPVEYRWDWGDGAASTTVDPGAPWPEHTVWHVYERATGEGETRSITLTTSWAGEYAVAGGPRLPVSGRATTTVSSPPFTVITARTALTDGSELATR